MISTYVAYDDFDEHLGEYFDQSFQYFQSITQDLDYVTCLSLDGSKCTEAHVSEILKDVNGKPFIFTAFSHGREDGASLCAGEADEFVCEINSHLFANTLFYSTACSVGSLLGCDLTENHNCRAFIGYTDESFAPFDESFNNLFIECELHGLKEFLNSEKSIEEVYSEMLKKIDDTIDYLYANDEYIDANFLERNRQALIHLGKEKSWTRLDFMNALKHS